MIHRECCRQHWWAKNFDLGPFGGCWPDPPVACNLAAVDYQAMRAEHPWLSLAKRSVVSLQLPLQDHWSVCWQGQKLEKVTFSNRKGFFLFGLQHFFVQFWFFLAEDGRRWGWHFLWIDMTHECQCSPTLRGDLEATVADQCGIQILKGCSENVRLAD